MIAATAALEALEALARRLGGDTGVEILERTEDVRRGVARAAAEADRLAKAQAEAVVSSVLLVEELEATREVLESAVTEAQAASAAKSAFVANMSHELRTPLNAIIGYSEMLMEEAARDGLTQWQADLARISQAGHHLLTFVESVLDLAKLETGQLPITLSEFGVDTLLEPLGTEIAAAATRKGLAFQLSVPPGLRMVSDPARVRQVLVNVLGNAVKFTPRGSVRCLVSANETSVTFQVTDTGIGIATEQQAHLFERFTQADTSHTRLHDGAGLGLHVGHRLCQLLGGSITVASETGSGTVVTVRLPVRFAAPDQAAPSSPSAAA